VESGIRKRTPPLNEGKTFPDTAEKNEKSLERSTKKNEANRDWPAAPEATVFYREEVKDMPATARGDGGEGGLGGEE